MTKIPRISGNAMIKYLGKKGFFTARSKGSHVTLKKDSIAVTVPTKVSELKIGLILGILNKVMINKDEFIRDHDAGLIK